jgi:hypothetical protein
VSDPRIQLRRRVDSIEQKTSADPDIEEISAGKMESFGAPNDHLTSSLSGLHS